MRFSVILQSPARVSLTFPKHFMHQVIFLLLFFKQKRKFWSDDGDDVKWGQQISQENFMTIQQFSRYLVISQAVDHGKNCHDGGDKTKGWGQK